MNINVESSVFADMKAPLEICKVNWYTNKFCSNFIFATSKLCQFLLMPNSQFISQYNINLFN
jgi:hypothetical protein